MRATLLLIARTLGVAAGPPQLEGRIYAVTHDVGHADDHPPWARLLRGAVLAAVAAVAVAAAAAHMLLSGRRRGVASPLTYGLAGFGVAKLLDRAPHPMQVWQLDTVAGRSVVRIDVPPSYATAVRPYDVVACWGAGHRDGTFRAYRAENRTTGGRVQPAHVSATTAACAAVLAVVGIAVVLSAI